MKKVPILLLALCTILSTSCFNKFLDLHFTDQDEERWDIDELDGVYIGGLTVGCRSTEEVFEVDNFPVVLDFYHAGLREYGARVILSDFPLDAERKTTTDIYIDAPCGQYGFFLIKETDKKPASIEIGGEKYVAKRLQGDVQRHEGYHRLILDPCNINGFDYTFNFIGRCYTTEDTEPDPDADSD